MSLMQKMFLALFLFLLIQGCTITGPAQDQWDLEENDSKIDPNLLLPNQIGDTQKTDTLNPASENTAPDPAYQEFLLYQEWKHEQAVNSPAYQEFKAYTLWKKNVEAQ